MNLLKPPSTCENFPHIPLTMSSIRSSNGTIFQEKRHTTQSLSKVVTEVSAYRGSQLIKSQRAALRSYQKFEIFNLSSKIPTDEIPDLDVLRAYQRFFSDLFFFNTLDDKSVSLALDSRDVKETSLAGYAGKIPLKWYHHALVNLGAGKSKAGPTFIITVVSKNSLADRRKRLTWYLSVLLHEMIHVFLQLFTCHALPCYSGLRHAGKTGHGFVFQEIAYAVESAVRDRGFLDLKLDLNRGKSLAQELVVSRVEELPDRLYLERWGLRGRDLWEQVRFLRSESWRRQKREEGLDRAPGLKF